MNIKKTINNNRKKIMNYLTCRIGSSSKLVDKNNSEIKRILICRPNHRLGNLLLMTPLIQEVTHLFPDCQIDLFVRGELAPVLFKNYGPIYQIIALPNKPFKSPIQYFLVWQSLRKTPYDLVINLNQGSSSGKLATKIVHARYKQFNVDPHNPLDQGAIADQTPRDSLHTAKAPVYSIRNYFGFQNTQAMPCLDIKLSLDEINNGKVILNELTHNAEPKIGLHTHATGIKNYPESWWLALYNKLKEQYGIDYEIVEILPVNRESRINFNAPTFYSNDIRAVASVIANTKLFICADGGIMHLASSTQTPTLGLFSVDNREVYQPYNKNSFSVDTNHTSMDEIIQYIGKALRTS